MPRVRKIQIRRGTTAEWTAVDPVLEQSEPGWDLTRQVLKIGDGAKRWSELPEIGSNTGGGVYVLRDVDGVPYIPS